MAMELNNTEYAFACRIDNIKEASQGNRVLSGCAVSANVTPDMNVDIAAGVCRINNAYVSVSSVDDQAINAAHGTYDRYDILSVDTSGTVNYAAGTAAANPYPPNLPADEILLAVIFVENNSSTVENADIQDNRIIYEDSGVQVPIGGIIPWLADFTGVPSIPTGFALCDGSTISDSESPLNGQTLPDLNGNNNFLRSADTSGGTGGNATHQHVWTNSASAGGDGGGGFWKHVDHTSDTENNEPPYYEVVMIIRIK